MELIGRLKSKVSKAKDSNEARQIIEEAGMRLSDDELDLVAGGVDEGENVTWVVPPPDEEAQFKEARFF